MFSNYLKIAVRNLWRSKSFSAINISGLAIGMASAILILLWIQNELSYDRFYSKTDRLYKIYSRDNLSGGPLAWETTPKPLGTAIKKDFPEVEKVARYRNVTFLTSVGETHLNTTGAFTDSSFLEMFDLPLLEGDAQHALNGGYNIVLTQHLAKSLFGNTDPMGKIVRIDSTENFTVAGVLKDLPSNTSFEFDYLLPYTFMTRLGWDDEVWDANSVYTFALLQPGASQAGFDAKLKNMVISRTRQTTTQEFSQPVGRLHLYSKSENGRLVDGRIEMVRLFSAIAAFILLIACINFMNLSTARSEKRAKEVGIRKVVGAYKGSLIAQFIGESILISILAFGIAILLVQVSLPSFDQLVGHQLQINYSNPLFWIFAVAFILFTGLLAGSYPAFYLSAFKPAKVLKGAFKSTNALVTPRKILVVLQFTFAIILIIGTVVIWRQIQYGQERNAGYNRNNLVFTFTQGDASKNYKLIKQELLRSGAAIAVNKSSGPITRHWTDGTEYQWEGSTPEDKKIDFINFGTDADFAKTMGVSILSGRDIDINQYPTDSTAMLLNESAVAAMRLKNPLGITITQEGSPTIWHVVGVVKDFIIESPFEKRIAPMLINGPLNFFQVINFKLNPANSTATNLAKAEKVFRQYNPLFPFEPIFVDEAYARKFAEEQRVGKLAALFAGLTIIISCLGLFALATYMAENRIKEIGVRKVLGASVVGITTMLAKDFIKLVLASFVIASPIAWVSMNQWLKDYHYKIDIGWEIFALSGALALLIAIVTVSWQSIRAAISNPVKNLRSE